MSAPEDATIVENLAPIVDRETSTTCRSETNRIIELR